MRKSEFDCLSQYNQVDHLYKKAVYLSKRKTSNITMILYQLDNFYVEIIYTSYRRKISEIKSSENTDLLGPYLMSIDVDELIGRNYLFKYN